MKLNVFDVIELKNKVKAIVLEISNNKYKVKRVNNLEEILLINKGEIKKVLYRKNNKGISED